MLNPHTNPSQSDAYVLTHHAARASHLAKPSSTPNPAHRSAKSFSKRSGTAKHRASGTPHPGVTTHPRVWAGRRGCRPRRHRQLDRCDARAGVVSGLCAVVLLSDGSGDGEVQGRFRIRLIGRDESQRTEGGNPMLIDTCTFATTSVQSCS